VIVDVQGVGYEVLMTKTTESRIQAGDQRTILICESVTAFDGATTLYGFLTKEEKEFFTRIRDNVDGMGPKKALECLDKISKSMPDFKRAVIDSDAALLVSVFGFTKKTAEKIIFALKGKMDSWVVAGPIRYQETPKVQKELDVFSGLRNLGYDEVEARDLIQRARGQVPADCSTEDLMKEALKIIGAKIS
jgi:Holliday junction DNA helicase RuvA